jgi:hypothetical protein
MMIVVIGLTKTAVLQIHQVCLDTNLGKMYTTVFSKCIYCSVFFTLDVYLLQIQGRYSVATLAVGLSPLHDHCVDCHKSAAIIREIAMLFFVTST